MTVALRERIWNAPKVVNGSTLVVLLILAEYADDDGRNACPAQETLAAKAGLSRAAVRKHLKALTDAGLVIKNDGSGVGPGGRKTDSYHLVMGTLVANNEEPSVGTHVANTSDASVGYKGANNAPLVGYMGAMTTSSEKPLVGETPSGFTAPPPSGTGAEITIGYYAEDDMPAPGFEPEEPVAPVKRSRWVEEDTDHLAAVGRIGKRPAPAQPKAPKPLAQWKANDFLAEFRRRVREVSPPGIPEQVMVGFAGKKFKEWLASGVSPEVIMATIDMFFDEPQNLHDIGKGYTLWQRYHYSFRHNVGTATERVAKGKTPTETVDTDWIDPRLMEA